MVIKISDDLAAVLGIHSQEEAVKLLQASQHPAAPEANEEIDKMKADITALTERVQVLEGRIEDLKAERAEAGFDAVAFKTELLQEASVLSAKQLAETVSRVGAQALPQPEPVEAAVKQEIAPDDYDGQWKANKSLRDEFLSFESYAAFMRHTG